MRDLPRPEFVKIDPAGVEADLIARYEAKSGKTLYPAQIERLFIDLIAYTRSRLDMSIQNAGEQLLVRFSSGPILDYLGELVATPRLLAQPARCQLRFTMPSVRSIALLVSAGTRVSTQDGKLSFTTDQDVQIAAGQLTTTVNATCMTAGAQGNGWAPGQISVISNSPLPGLVATNISETADAADDEDDDRYRERIILAPEAFSNAGSRGAYRYHALAVHQSITDVAVHGPDEGQIDGHVALFLLTNTGLPSQSIIDQVKARLSAETVRPLCDTVHAWACTEVAYTIRARLTFYATAEQADTLAAAQQAAEAYAADRRSKLGLDLVREQLTAALQVSGVYRAELELPSGLHELQGNEWANCTAIELIPEGVAYG